MIFKSKKEKLYKKASKVALDNAQLLYDEAKLLHNNKYHARSFALGIICLEESAKAFLLRLISLNLIDETIAMKHIRKHERKLEQAGQIVSFTIEFAKILIELIKISQELGSFTKEDALTATRNYTENAKIYSQIADEITRSQPRKLDAIYVDVRGGKIINPTEMIDNERSSALLEIIDRQTRFVEILINQDNDKIIQLWNSDLVANSVSRMKALLKNEPTLDMKKIREAEP